MTTYGYIRVSSATQNIERQLDELYKLNLKDSQIFIDYQSGSDFNRGSYKKLLKKIKKDDLLIVKSIDRLGRNYQMIIDEWQLITKKIGANIFVTDMPLLDTRIDDKNLIGVFISDIVLQILSFVAETERTNIKQRQAEGIRLAKEKGIHLGRPKYNLPKNYYAIALDYTNQKISLTDALETLQMKRSTFFKFLNMHIKNNNT